MIIKKDQVIYKMSKHNKPVLKAKSQDTIVFETMDCFSCEIKSENDKLAGINFDKVNPATGPLYVEDAKVGDTLKVTILSIEVEEQGTAVVEPCFGRLGKEIKTGEVAIVKIDGDEGIFKGKRFPLNKMIGVIGTAPAEEEINTGTPGTHGGNMDCTQVKEGANIYLPVNVDGALLAMGDLHAAMGDGEISGAGLEISGRVKVKIEVIKNFQYSLPMIETEDKWIAVASADDMPATADKAIKNLAELVMDKNGFTLNEATMFLSLQGNLIACQAVNPQHTMRMEISKKVLG
ncbi:MAG: acetamidase/formamidase family protein [Treponema phagedenis]|uniref:acetamidase/formamidase family protein n=1 Tax=Treponema phagedenis TaxID=162 RepID=UPI0004638F1F|nr:acetamidase/formamidase family protein [Treponema phagedenis]